MATKRSGPPSSPSRRATTRVQLRRRQILLTAERLFYHYGPGKTTVADIAREIGIGVGTVYLEFCSKDDIVGELLKRRQARVLERMQAASRRGTYAQRLTGALEARVLALFELADEGAHACDLIECSMPQASSGGFTEPELQIVAGLVEAGARDGEFAVRSPEQAARALHIAHAAFAPPQLFRQDRRQVLQQLHALNALLLEGLLARPRPASERRTSRRAGGGPTVG